MTPTVENLNAWIAPVLQLFPSVDTRFCSFLAKEISAFQQNYFLYGEEVVDSVSLTAPADMRIDLAEVTSSFEIPLTKQTVKSVFLNGRRLKTVSCTEFMEDQGDCCAFFDGILCLHSAKEENARQVVLIYRLIPPEISYSASLSGFTGMLYLPPACLTLVQNKALECLYRYTGEHDEADAWAKAFNEGLDRLPEEIKPRDRTRKQL